MAINFKVAKGEYPDNSTTLATDIETWLDGLSITTVHSVGLEHVHGL